MTRRKKKDTTNKAWGTIGSIFAAVLFIAVICVIVLIGYGVFAPDDGQKCNTLNVQVEPVHKQAHHLGNDLQLLSVGKYAGIYLEDGSNQVVSDILMIQVANNSQKDLQFGRIVLIYPDFTAEFEATNIPAGRTVVLLEKNRREYVNEKYTSAVAQNLVFFSNNMTTWEDKIEISGRDGALDVKNISGEDIVGDIYIYYKYASGDQLYGGITFRAKISNGLDSGEVKQVMASHYDMDSSVILAADFGE